MISVIMPTNRVDQHFDIAVRSILESTGVDIELVIVLDGVEADLTQFSWGSDSRLKWVRTPEPSGPGGAMGHGIAASVGEYIARMDSDDRSLPSRLEVQAQFLDDNPETVAVSCRTSRIDEHGQATGSIKLPSGADIRNKLLFQNVVPHSTLVFRRTSADRIGGYRTDLHQMEDYVFILALAIEGPIAQLPDRLLEYRVHSAQTSLGAAARGAHIEAVIDARRLLGKHLGVHPLARWGYDLLWLTVQHLRARGIRKPGHRR